MPARRPSLLLLALVTLPGLASKCLADPSSPASELNPIEAAFSQSSQELTARCERLRGQLGSTGLALPLQEGVGQCLEILLRLLRSGLVAEAYQESGADQVLEAQTGLDLVRSWLGELEAGRLDQRLPLPDPGRVQELLALIRDNPGGEGIDWVRFQFLWWLDRTGCFEASTGSPFILRNQDILDTWMRDPQGLVQPAAPGLEKLREPLREVAGTLLTEMSSRSSGPTCLQDFATRGARYLKSQLPWPLFEQRSLLRRYIALTQLQSLALLEAPPATKTSEPKPSPDPSDPPGPVSETPLPLAWLLLLPVLGGAGWMGWRRRSPGNPTEAPASLRETVPSAPRARLPAGEDEAATRRSDVPPASANRTSVAASGASDLPGNALADSSGEMPSWLRRTIEHAVGDRYRDLRRLGAGGMGSVVRAWDRRLERLVAIKVPPPQLAELAEFRERFLREGRALARLQHENVAGVYDVPEVPEGETPVLVLEHLAGDELVEAGGDAPRVLEWLEQVAAALDHLHERGVLHRNVKPSSVVVGPDGVARLTDLGFASVKDASSMTGIGITFGDPAYLAPEHVAGAPLDAAADHYALAAVAYRVLFGHPPFDPTDRERSRPPGRALTASLPESVDGAFAAALAPDPAARPRTASGFIGALRVALEGP